MGQYGNQPDFGTRAENTAPTGDSIATGYKLNSAALYIGTGGTLVCKVVGNDPSVSYFSIFTNIPNGTFFPVIVDYVFTDNGDDAITTCSDIVALY